LKNRNGFKGNKINRRMRQIKITAYERDGGDYVVGISKGVKEGAYRFAEGCVISGKTLTELQKSMSFEEALKQAYSNEKSKGDRILPLRNLLTPQPHTIELMVE
jgi:hypothetical protein